MGACASSKEVGEDPLVELGNRLDQVPTYYPGTDFGCLTDSNGDIIVDKNLGSVKEASEVLQNIFLLKKASCHFSKTLDPKCSECEIIHVRGDFTIVTLWNITVDLEDSAPGDRKNVKNRPFSKPFVLMFKTKIPGGVVNFDIDEADDFLKKSVIVDIQRYLKMYCGMKKK